MADEAQPDEDIIVRAVMRLARELRHAAGPTELTGAALGLLATLHRDGAMSAVELAQREGLQPQSLSRLLAQLDKDRLIDRSVDDKDARRHVIVLTQSGLGALARSIHRRREWLADRMAERLNAEEQEALLDAAELMLRMAL